jgi:4-oxalocrotonate tautomerase
MAPNYAVATSPASSVSVPASIQFLNWPQRGGPWETAAHAAGLIPQRQSNQQVKGTVIMPLVDVQLIEGVFDKNQKQAMISKITDAMVEIEGEAMRGVTWVRVHEVASGNWGIGGKGLTTADVKALQANGR